MRWAALLAFCLFGALIWAADQGALPEVLFQIDVVLGGDKIDHFALVAVLGYVFNWALSGREVRQKIKVTSWTRSGNPNCHPRSNLAVVFPTRTFSLWDLGSGYLGIWPVIWLLSENR